MACVLLRMIRHPCRVAGGYRTKYRTKNNVRRTTLLSLRVSECTHNRAFQHVGLCTCATCSQLLHHACSHYASSPVLGCSGVETWPARLGLARVSVLRASGDKVGVPFIDDYIRASEPVADHLTKWSGINAGDLDAATSHRWALRIPPSAPCHGCNPGMLFQQRAAQCSEDEQLSAVPRGSDFFPAARWLLYADLTGMYSHAHAVQAHHCSCTVPLWYANVFALCHLGSTHAVVYCRTLITSGTGSWKQ